MHILCLSYAQVTLPQVTTSSTRSKRASMLVEICASAVRLIGPCVFRSRSVFAPGCRGEFPFTKVVLSPYTVYDVSRLTYRSL